MSVLIFWKYEPTGSWSSRSYKSTRPIFPQLVKRGHVPLCKLGKMKDDADAHTDF